MQRTKQKKERTEMRRKVQFIQGGYYHIYNRGAGRNPIFRDEDDYSYVLRAMKKYSAQFSFAIIAYCLMPNHYHWLVRQDSALSVQLLPQRVFNGYSKNFNKRHERSGTLFEGPYKANPVDSDEYLRHLCRYIHANPLKDGIVSALDMWPYSNIHEWMGWRTGTLFDPAFINDFFPDRKGYHSWVLDYVAIRQLPKDLAGYLAALEGDA